MLRNGNTFPLARVYGPPDPFFDQTWKPGDIEPV
jgi:hypothetical protein